MTALSVNTDRGLQGGELAHFPLEASANPYQGSLLSRAADGYVHELVSGEPFVGVCQIQVESGDAPAADGDLRCNARRGVMLAEVPLTGVAIDDAVHARRVFASDDATFSFTTGSLVGVVVGVASSNRAIVLLMTADVQHLIGAAGVLGVKTMAATGAQSLVASDCGKLVLVPNTAALTITLPAAADCTGKGIIVKKSSADAEIVTLDGSGTEEIDGSATNTSIDAANDMLHLVSDGTGWHIVSSLIA